MDESEPANGIGELAGKIKYMEYDVVIIGSGPAGCAAAISCRSQGLNTLIITGKEKKHNQEAIRPSESIHPGVVSLLEQLGAAHCVEAASRGTYQGIEVKGVQNAFGEDEHGPWQGHHIDRKIFDSCLLEIAIQQGTEVIKDETVTDIIIDTGNAATVVLSSAKKITGNYIIDASGVKSVAAKKSAFKKIMYSPPLFTWTGVSHIEAGKEMLPGNFTQFIPQQNGWTWLAHEAGGRYTWTQLQTKGNTLFTVPAEFENEIDVTNIKKTNRRWHVSRPVCTEQVILCGDAAGVIDPAAGQGILNALLSGMMAAKAAYSCIRQPELEAFFLAKYDYWFFTRYLENVEKLKHFYELHTIKIFDSK